MLVQLKSYKAEILKGALESHILHSHWGPTASQICQPAVQPLTLDPSLEQSAVQSCSYGNCETTG